MTMAVESLNCKCCGGILKTGASICECEFCGAINVVTGESGKYINQLNRANKLRQQKDFDRAIKIYDDILAENPPSADVLWSKTLCEYGIEFVSDPVSGRYVPTLHRIKEESILDFPSYIEAIEISDEKQKETIENEAKEIVKIQNEYLDIVSKEKPYDVFICYKETDDSTNQQTEDSGLGLDLYERLEKYGLKVFFSRVTLQDKIGVNYEPYIFGALKSARVMVVIGTKAEYFNAVWVKNEWSRFLKFKENDKEKQIFFACDDIDDLPRAFSGRQAQLLNQPNAIQNLAFTIKKCIDQLEEFEEPHHKKQENSTPEKKIYLFTTRANPGSKKAKNYLGNIPYILIESLEHPELVRKYAVKMAPTLVVDDGISIVKYVSLDEIKKYVDSQKDQPGNNTEEHNSLINFFTGKYAVDSETIKTINKYLNHNEKDKAVNEFCRATNLSLKEGNDALDLYVELCKNLAKDAVENGLSGLKKELEDNNLINEQTKKKGGCYVATCVYGSYDCPEVWTLRRFRDDTLDKTWYGRVFIKTYYAISPTIVKLLGDYSLFKIFWKKPLDEMVNRLQASGYDDTPYDDKY